MAIRILLTAGLLGAALWFLPWSDHEVAAIQLRSGAWLKGDRFRDEGSQVVLEGPGTQTRSFAAADVLKRERGVEPGFPTVLRTADAGGVLPALLLIGLVLWIDSERWRLLLRVQGIALGSGRAMRLTLVGGFFNTLLPGISGGDVVKAVLIARDAPERRARSVLTVAADRIIGLFALAVVAFAAAWTQADRPEILKARIAATAVLAGLAGGFGVYLLPHWRRWNWTRAVGRRLPYRQVLGELDAAVMAHRGRPGVVAATFGISLVAHALGITALWLCGRAVHVGGLDWMHYAIYGPLAAMLSAVPMSIGGLGVTAWFFHLVAAVPMQNAMALDVVQKLTIIAWSLVGGVLVWTRAEKPPEESA